MKESDLIEKVCKGLRYMKVKPDFLLFRDTQSLLMPEEISNVPLLYSPYLTGIAISAYPYDCSICVFIPCWKTQEKGNFRDIMQFNRGYFDKEVKSFEYGQKYKEISDTKEQAVRPEGLNNESASKIEAIPKLVYWEC